MIRTKEIMQIDPIMRFEGVVYMEAKKVKDSDVEGIVEFDNYFYTLQTKEQIVLMPRTVTEQYCSAVDENGNPVISTREIQIIAQAKANVTALVEFKKRPAIYKQSTFQNKFSNLTKQMYDESMISEIDYVNTRDWTGSEAQKVFFWNLRASNMEIVTEQELNDLLTVEFIEWVDE